MHLSATGEPYAQSELPDSEGPGFTGSHRRAGHPKAPSPPFGYFPTMTGAPAPPHRLVPGGRLRS